MKSRRSIRFIASILFVRATRVFMKLLRLKGTHFPGQLAKKLCPDFLMRIEKPDKIIAVTGTNGKTTVANMVADLARTLGLTFAHNAYGSNIEEGIITTLLDATTLTGKKKLPLAILEIDERLTRIIFRAVHPDYLIVTNLFRESYLRNGHGEFIYNLLNESIPAGTHVIVNADDLLSQNLAIGRSHTSFGIARLPGEKAITESQIRDVVLCPRCHGPLTDSFIRYHHIGRSRCEACGWHSLIPDYEITAVLAAGSRDALPINKLQDADTLALNTKAVFADGSRDALPINKLQDTEMLALNTKAVFADGSRDALPINKLQDADTLALNTKAVFADGSRDALPINNLQGADTLALNTEDGEERFPFRGENILDLYNELAAITLFRTLGRTRDEIAEALSGIVIGKSRREVIKVGDKRIYRMLAKGKNPIAVSRVVSAVHAIPGKKQFILLVDTSSDTVTSEDNAAWIFDADLGLLNDDDITRVVVAGNRCEDIRLALLFAGVDDRKIVTRRDRHDAADALLFEEEPETIAILYSLYSEPISRIVLKRLHERLEKTALKTDNARCEKHHHERLEKTALKTDNARRDKHLHERLEKTALKTDNARREKHLHERLEKTALKTDNARRDKHLHEHLEKE
ncbi:MAG: MurT ligase domain-containing protein [Saccharofermentanales bacterium]